MTEPGDLNWLLDSLVNQIAQVRHAIVLSADGLVIGSSRGLAREDAEHLAALSSGFQSLARTTADHFRGGAVRQSIVEMDDRFLFVTAAGSGACLSVLTDADADVGVIAYEMAMLVTRVGRHLSARPREQAVR
ncbi:roadblock/LC7 domain-containing protein [Actinocorallia longicatena]|uniref:Roadblock/LC7 domain-containing protein n=1 Tax=Actinocorallia longicatena TaxID=111803 RepID=A0ABP6QBM8_9ACTN